MTSFKKLLIKNTSWLAVSETISMLILFVVTVIIARSLGDTIYGQFAFILAFAQIWQVLADFGLTMIGVRELATHKENIKKYLNNFLALKLVASILTFGLIILTVQFLNKPDFIKNLIYVASGYIVLYTAAEFLRSVFRALEKFKYEAYIKISQHLILLTLIIFTASQHSLNLITWSYLIASAYSVVLTLIIIWQKISHFSLDWDSRLIKYLIKEAWPLALANVFVVIYFRIDTIMLSLMKSDQATGWYNAAYLLIFSLSFVAYVIMMSVYPKLSQLVKDSLNQAKRLYRQTLYLISLSGVLILGLSALIAKYLIPLLYGDKFLPAVTIFYILTIAVWFAYLANVWLYTLNALGRQKIYTWATALGMVLNLILNFIFIPRYSYLGAAWATVITEIIVGLIIFIACERVFKKGLIESESSPPPIIEKNI